MQHNYPQHCWAARLKDAQPWYWHDFLSSKPWAWYCIQPQAVGLSPPRHVPACLCEASCSFAIARFPHSSHMLVVSCLSFLLLSIIRISNDSGTCSSPQMCCRCLQCTGLASACSQLAPSPALSPVLVAGPWPGAGPDLVPALHEAGTAAKSPQAGNVRPCGTDVYTGARLAGVTGPIH